MFVSWKKTAVENELSKHKHLKREVPGNVSVLEEDVTAVENELRAAR